MRVRTMAAQAPIPKARPGTRTPLLTSVTTAVFTIVTSYERRDEGIMVNFSQYEPNGRITNFQAWLVSAVPVALSRDRCVMES